MVIYSNKEINQAVPVANFADIAFTPTVQGLQQRDGSRA